MTLGRAGVDLKFARANELIDQLEAEVATFLASSPFAVEEVEAGNGDLLYLARTSLRPPMGWSLIIGDAIHNARSALDQLAWRLVEVGGGTPDASTSFPITDNELHYANKLRNALKGATPAARAAVRAMSPWEAGDRKLWQLHRLDIIDKHRLLVPVGATSPTWGFQLPVAHFLGADDEDAPYLRFETDPQFPLEDGTELLRIAKLARQGYEPLGTWRHAFQFEVAFGDGTVVDGRPIVSTLRDLVTHAAQVSGPLTATIA